MLDMTVTLANLISMGAAAWLADQIGLRQTFMFAGVMLLLGGLAMVWMLRGIKLEKVDQPALVSDAIV